MNKFGAEITNKGGASLRGKVGGTITVHGGLPGNASVLNSNEHSDNSANMKPPNNNKPNLNMPESQIHSIKTSQIIGAAGTEQGMDAQLNQQITINNNISITTIHNHDQADKDGKEQKVYAPNTLSKNAHGLAESTRFPHSTVAANINAATSAAHAATNDSLR